MFAQLLQSNPVKTVSVVGLAKNVGKTTALNCLIRGAHELGLKIGVCSIGVDGEKQDVWNYHDKPPVYLFKGMLAATAASCLEEATTNYRIVKQLKSHSPMGAVFIVEALEDGELKLAGTYTTEDVENAFQCLQTLGAERCFVDGAYDRIATAKPDLTESTILCVGASIAPTLEQVIDEVASAVTRLALPIHKEPLPVGNEIGYVKEGKWNSIASSSLMTHMNEVLKVASDGIETLYVPGGLTNRLFEQLTSVKQPFTIVIQDGTRCFVSYSLLKRWFRRGGSVLVQKPIQLLAVTVNPTSPQGYYFHPKAMMEQVKRYAGNVPVIDCVRGEIV